MINMPLIWIGIPILVGVLLIPFARHRKISIGIVSVISLLLAIIALIFPSNLAVEAFGKRYEFNPLLSVLGRLFRVEYTSLTAIALLYLVNFAWNFVSLRFSVSQYFAPLSLITTALWVATLAVEPFLYAAVIVTIIVLVSIPLFSPRGETDQPGLFRYLILQALAMPLILLSGWMLAGIGSAPSASPLIVRATVMVLLGFSLWLGVFPLHSWLPMLSNESHPWVVSMLLSGRQLALLVYLLYFLDRYAWLRNLPNLFRDIQVFGLVMIAVGGINAASQKNYKRLFGYFFLIETGYSLLSIGLAPDGGLVYFGLLFVPRFLCYWLWAFSVAELTDKGGMTDSSMNQLKGLFHRAPFLASGMFFSLLALTGSPLFALFPVKRMIWMLAGAVDLKWLFLLLIGTFAMVVLIFNFLRTAISPSSATDLIQESLFAKIVICVAILLILAVGLFPHVFLTPWIHLIDPFNNLVNAFK
ncbi:MAG: proton-conducting transporter membrane subunit [Anaerolineaceae bacterium]